MDITRRDFNTLACTALAGLALSPLALAQASRDEWFQWEEVGDGVFVAIGEGGNAMVVRSAAHALLVDCKNIGFAGALMREAEAHAARPTIVVNTHHHADHTGGNHAFLNAGLPVWAHPAALPRIGAQLDAYRDRLRAALRGHGTADTPVARAVRADMESFIADMDTWTAEDFRPTDAYDGKTRQLMVGDRAVTLQAATPAHTDNDTFVWLPDANVLHTGDLVFNGLNPYIDVGAGATTRGWDRALDTMLALVNEQTRVVPGHGPVAGPGVLRAQKDYFATLRDAVRAAIDGGADREAVTRLKPEGVASLGREQGLPQNLGIVFDELKSE